MGQKEDTTIIASRVALELSHGDIVNLGIGIPTLVANYIPTDSEIILTSENGIVGFGGAPDSSLEDENLVNAGGGYITEIPHSSYIDSCTSFGIIRGGHLDVAVLGALQVDQEGSLANWMIPGKFVPGMGGAMDLCFGAKKVIAAFKHVDKSGNSKILKKCTLPLTAHKKVKMIVTDLCVIEITSKGAVLKEIAYTTTIEDVLKRTEASLIIPDKVLTFGNKTEI